MTINKYFFIIFLLLLAKSIATFSQCSFTPTISIGSGSPGNTFNNTCPNQSYTYTTEAGKTNYTWIASQGSIVSGQGTSSVSIVWNPNQSGSVSVSYTSGGCTASSPTQPVQILAGATITGSSTGVANSSNNLYTTNPGKSNYFWSILPLPPATQPGGTISSNGANSAYISWTGTGPQQVFISYTDASSVCPNVSGSLAVNIGTYTPLPIHGNSTACQGQSFYYWTTNNSSYQYNWNVVGGHITSGAGTSSVNIVWDNTGSQSISLTYSSGGVSYDTPTIFNVAVNSPILPTPSLNISGGSFNNVCAGSYTFTSDGGMENYTWRIVDTSTNATLLDGTTNSLNSQVWSFPSGGNYTVSVNYSNSSFCSATSPTSKNLSVLNSVASISSNVGSCAAGTTGIFTTESGKSLYGWSIYVISLTGQLTSATSSQAQIISGSATNQITVQFNQAKNYLITVYYPEPSTGCYNNGQVNVSFSQPSPDVVNSSGQALFGTIYNICSGNTVPLYAYPTDKGYSFQWLLNGNPIPGANSNTLNASQTGVYTVMASNIATCSGVSSSYVSVNVYPNPILYDSKLCLGSTATFSPSSGGTWVSSNPSVATITNSGVVTPIAVGSVTFTFTSASTTCSYSTPSILVSSKPNVSIPPVSYCLGSSFNLSPTSGGTWVSSNNSAATVTNSGLVTPTGLGNSVVFTFTDSSTGCSNATSSITFIDPPTVTLPNTSLCLGGTMTIFPVSGGTWTSSNPSIATVTNAGLVTSVTAGSVTFTYTNSTTGCSSTTPALTVNPTPSVNTIPNKTFCNGAASTVSFSGVATAYNWTNSNTAIGLAASGTGDISFTATNPGATPVSSTITVTPVYGTCTGTSKTFTITINPTPTVNTVANQTVCKGALTTAVSFSGTATSYTWTNTTTSIGLAASGTGNIAAFTSVNSGTAPVVATITVTPLYGTCAGATTSFTITVNPAPSVTAIANKTACNGATVAATAFSGTATSFNWTNNNTSIGLAASGTGNIAAFTAANSGTSTNVATITVTPLYGTCTGTARTFTITVNPTPVVNAVANQTFCNATATTAIAFSGVGTSYTWTNNKTTIGLAASGTGNIPSFTAANTGTTPVVATITVTPHYGSCNGSAKTFTITVNPTPIINAVSSQTICQGLLTTAVNFTGQATSYAWTNDTPSIGLAASGTGNIAAFTAVNNGAAAVTATIMVTPQYGLCTGTTTSFTITVNPAPALSVPQQSLCMGSSMTLSPTTGGTWTSSNTGVATITNAGVVTPVSTGSAIFTFTNTATGCMAATSSIIVNPVPSVNAITSQTVCNGNLTSAVNFSGTGLSYAWTNDTPSIGLAASGTGNIGAFSGINSSATAITATITVTPVYGTCTGTTKTFTITVNPTPSLTINVNGYTTFCS